MVVLGMNIQKEEITKTAGPYQKIYSGKTVVGLWKLLCISLSMPIFSDCVIA